ncbi:MAG: hypothetical protein KKF56_03415 [Nanoarchaeota archaeon]|nr:hypothetical protein [Nanoarchaeota archaeon]
MEIVVGKDNGRYFVLAYINHYENKNSIRELDGMLSPKGCRSHDEFRDSLTVHGARDIFAGGLESPEECGAEVQRFVRESRQKIEDIDLNELTEVDLARFMNGLMSDYLEDR